jgi:hypothetical protein
MDNIIREVTGILQVQKADESSATQVFFENIVKDIIEENKETIKLYKGILDTDFERKKSIRYIEPFLSSIVKNLVNN